MTPCVGCIMAVKVMPTPIVDTSTGKKMTDRRKPRAMIGEVSMTPSSSPSTTFAPEVTAP